MDLYAISCVVVVALLATIPLTIRSARRICDIEITPRDRRNNLAVILALGVPSVIACYASLIINVIVAVQIVMSLFGR